MRHEFLYKVTDILFIKHTVNTGLGIVPRNHCLISLLGSDPDQPMSENCGSWKHIDEPAEVMDSFGCVYRATFDMLGNATVAFMKPLERYRQPRQGLKGSDYRMCQREGCEGMVPLDTKECSLCGGDGRRA